MYVTRPLSLYRTNPQLLSLPPPEGPNSGYLVIQDDDEEPVESCCFGFCKWKARIKFSAPSFPQNKLLCIEEDRPSGDSSPASDVLYFIPAINMPLSSNIYYAMTRIGREDGGQAYAGYEEEELLKCCCCNLCCSNSVDVIRPFDPADVHQQFKFPTDEFGNLVLPPRCVASDGHPPLIFRVEGLSIYPLTFRRDISIGEAEGLDPRLRAHLPEFSFPLSYQYSKPVVVGKWYCPRMFVEDLTYIDHARSPFYEITLEQIWERIFLYEKKSERSSEVIRAVMVDTTIQRESIKVVGINAMQDHKENDINTMVWFKRTDGAQDQAKFGLSSLIVERMMWEEERAGWVPKEEKQEKVSKIEDFGGVGTTWESYGCYMLVERFVFKRINGTEVLTYSFNHTHQRRNKWE